MTIKTLPLWYLTFCREVLRLRAGKGKKKKLVSYLSGYVDALLLAGLINDDELDVLLRVVDNAATYRGK